MEYQIHRDRTKLILQVADVKDDEPVSQIHVRRFVHEPRVRTFRVLLKPERELVAAPHVLEHRDEIAEEWRRDGAEIGFRGDVARGVCFADCLVQDRVVLRRECSQHDLEQPNNL